MLAWVKTQQVNAPGLFAVDLRKSQLAEWDLHFNDIALVVNPARRIPDRVPRVVLALRNVVVGEVHLHTKRVGEELERAAAVPVGVNHDPDEIVVECRVAVSEEGTNGFGIRIFRVEGDEQALAVLNNVGDGLDTGREVLARARFGIDIDSRGVLPGVLIDDTVDRDFAIRGGQFGNIGPGHGRDREQRET